VLDRHLRVGKLRRRGLCANRDPYVLQAEAGKRRVWLRAGCCCINARGRPPPWGRAGGCSASP